MAAIGYAEMLSFALKMKAYNQKRKFGGKNVSV